MLVCINIDILIDVGIHIYFCNMCHVLTCMDPCMTAIIHVCVYTHVCNMYVCTYIYISAYMHTSMDKCIHSYACTYKALYNCQYTYLDEYIHISYMHTHVYTFIHVYIFICIYLFMSNICIYGHAYTHICPCMSAYICVYQYSYIYTCMHACL